MTHGPKRPPTRVVVKPGESPFLALAREMVERPDGVVSLNIQSAVNRFAAPRLRAIEQLVEALGEQIENPGDQLVRAKVGAAISCWEKTCDAQMTPETLSGFEEEARELLKDKKTRPPPMREVLRTPVERRDFGYELGGDLSGIEGIWHRLWASISMDRLMSVATGESIVPQLRAEFEQQLGRPLDADEWRQLVEHAHRHCDTVMRPQWGGDAS
jgi:hypothetical protein